MLAKFVEGYPLYVLHHPSISISPEIAYNLYLSYVHNFADQLHTIGYKLVMLGDETWIKLFPTLFYRQDGVSSFYVSLVSCITCFSYNGM